MSFSVLIVEDELDTLRSYEKALAHGIKSEPLSVDGVDTVRKALARLKRNRFDLLVVDLRIRGTKGEEMGGLQLISESQRLDPLQTVIIITGYGTVELARKALQQGVFDFIEKSDTAVDDLVETVKRAIAERESNIVRYGNPFTRMTDEEPTVFGGRIEELTFVQKRLDRLLHSKFREHFLVLGDWGIGKSSLLRECRRVCQARGYLASFVRLEPFEAGTRLIDVTRSIVEGILRDIPFPVSRLKRVSEFFESIGVSVLGSGIEFSRSSRKDSPSPQAFLHDTLSRLWMDLKDEATVIVILLDDLDNLLAVPEIVMTLKQTLALDAIRDARILVGMSCTSQRSKHIPSIRKHHPLSRYFVHRLELDPLTHTEVRDTVLHSLSGTGVTFSRDTVERIFTQTEGHPFEMQVLAHHLFDSQLSGRVEDRVWEKALESAVRDMGLAVFDHLYDQASKQEAKVLRMIAIADKPQTAQGIRDTLSRGPSKMASANVSKCLQRLLEKRLVARIARGRYDIPDRMFRAYLCILEERKGQK